MIVIDQAGDIPVLCFAKSTQIDTSQRQCVELKKEIKVFRPDMIVISEETLLQCDRFYIGEMDRFQLAQQIADILVVLFHLLLRQLNNIRWILRQLRAKHLNIIEVLALFCQAPIEDGLDIGLVQLLRLKLICLFSCLLNKL